MSNALTDELKQSNGLVTKGIRRLYRLDVGKRLYDLDFTAPYQLILGGKTIEASGWGELLTKTISELLEIHPEKESLLLSFSSDWTKTSLFSQEKRVNFNQIRENLFINVNHTSVHACWFLYDLLNFFNINLEVCEFFIHRMPRAEPTEIREAVLADMNSALSHYLIWKKLLSEEKVQKVLRNIGVLNKKFKDLRGNSGYDDLLLFDDPKMFASAKSKFLADLSEAVFPLEPEKVKVCRHYLDYLTDFYLDISNNYKDR